MMRKKILLTTLLVFFAIFHTLSLFSQETSLNGPSFYRLSYGEFVTRLAKHNLSYAAERYHIDMADAELEAAKILPDPELSFSVIDNQNRRMKMGYGFEVELEWDLELGGKRAARHQLAVAERDLTAMEVDQFFNELRTEATLAYLEALKNIMEYDLKLESYEVMQELANQDSIRLEKGLIKSSTARQSKLQAASKKNEVNSAASVVEFELMDLNLFIKREKSDSIFVPTGNLSHLSRDFKLEELIETALSNCGTLKIAQHETKVADYRVGLARAERVMDLGLSIGIENNSFEQHIIAPTPGYTAVFAGVSVPLQFSNKRNPDLKIAQFEKEQAELNLAENQMILEEEITKAYRNYHSKQRQLRGMNDLVKEAKENFQEQIEEYNNGNTSFLEVLHAEEIYLQIQSDFINTLYEYATVLIELESMVGIWDIDF